MEQNPDYCVGVRILLSRMQSNPEEFTSNGSKWKRLLDQVIMCVEQGRSKVQSPNYLTGLNDEEILALYKALQVFLRKSFDDYVLAEVLASEKEELSYSVTSAPPTVLGNSHGGSWQRATSVTSNTSVEEMLKEIKATMNM